MHFPLGQPGIMEQIDLLHGCSIDLQLWRTAARSLCGFHPQALFVLSLPLIVIGVSV
jgi:hypothetical protein